MEYFAGRTAVITGGASGIGLALGRRATREDMQVVAVDIDDEALARAADVPGVTAVKADVSCFQDVQRLAQVVADRFGIVDLVVANAGIVGPTSPRLWEIPIEQWRRVVDVNLFGVIHTLQAFVPLLATDDAHVVITASMAGLAMAPTLTPYFATKHAIVSVAESLRHQFQRAGSSAGVSVLVPGKVATSLSASRTGTDAPDVPGVSALVLTADEVADRTFRALHDGELYVVTHPEGVTRVRERVEPILEAFERAAAGKGDDTG